MVNEIPLKIIFDKLEELEQEINALKKQEGFRGMVNNWLKHYPSSDLAHLFPSEVREITKQFEKIKEKLDGKKDRSENVLKWLRDKGDEKNE